MVLCALLSWVVLVSLFRFSFTEFSASGSSCPLSFVCTIVLLLDSVFGFMLMHSLAWLPQASMQKPMPICFFVSLVLSGDSYICHSAPLVGCSVGFLSSETGTAVRHEKKSHRICTYIYTQITAWSVGHRFESEKGQPESGQ